MKRGIVSPLKRRKSASQGGARFKAHYQYNKDSKSELIREWDLDKNLQIVSMEVTLQLTSF